ncbi:hypothetical protein KY358_04885 [Candidatus Woesearchaeota archaeon]|nr:hypothetical protein [Candidatus Woesearchaeota archaeon]
MNRRSALQLSVNFIVILIICIVVFTFSIYILRRMFSHAETIKMTYDERAEKEIERLLDDGSRVAVPFDTKSIFNGDSGTFGLGVLNILGTSSSNTFQINISFNKAFGRDNDLLCSLSNKDTSLCGNPESWLQSSSGGNIGYGLLFNRSIRNNEQEKFLLGVGVKNAPSGTYIFDLDVRYHDDTDPIPSKWNFVAYDTLHKLYVSVP